MIMTSLFSCKVGPKALLGYSWFYTICKSNGNKEKCQTSQNL